MAKRFAGKTVVVTGGNSGIGLATAKLFHEEGARVAISGRDQKTLDEAVKTIGEGTLAVKADVSKLADIDKLYTQVTAKLARSTLSSPMPASPSSLPRATAVSSYLTKRSTST
jgi:NAD(P)-dependent dehydrogenase (short-subunit alcohol dehydrogenase family)